MCGRYLLAMEIDEVVKSYNIKNKIIDNFQTGEQFPGTNIPIIIRKNNENLLKKTLWGIKYLNEEIA